MLLKIWSIVFARSTRSIPPLLVTVYRLKLGIKDYSYSKSWLYIVCKNWYYYSSIILDSFIFLLFPIILAYMKAGHLWKKRYTTHNSANLQDPKEGHQWAKNKNIT